MSINRQKQKTIILGDFNLDELKKLNVEYFHKSYFEEQNAILNKTNNDKNNYFFDVKHFYN